MGESLLKAHLTVGWKDGLELVQGLHKVSYVWEQWTSACCESIIPHDRTRLPFSLFRGYELLKFSFRERYLAHTKGSTGCSTGESQ